MSRTYFLPLFVTVTLLAQDKAPGVDPAIDPCVNFYQYSCNLWRAENPIPADRASWSSFGKLDDRNQAILRDILENAAKGGAERGPIEQKIGDMYASCMDESAVNKSGLEPIRPDLDRIAAMKSKSELTPELARLHRVGADVLFNFDSGADFKNSKMNIPQAAQGGLGLPDRDYYTRTDPKSVELRSKYVAHLKAMFALMGESAEQSAKDASAVMAIETELAKGSLDNVARRDPQQTYHKLTVHQLVSLAPFLDWPKYFAEMHTPSFESLNVESPAFFRALESTVVLHSLDEMKAYLRWHLVSHEAPWLPAAFVNQNFAFYGTTLTGAKELRPRWKRCVALVDGDLGDALGQKYAEKAFSPESKRRTLELVQQIEQAMKKDIDTLNWMSPGTKKEALVKLAAVANKIGYPNKWRDYSSVVIKRTGLAANDMRATEYELARHMDRIGKPVDRMEWEMTPPTVNAYYNPVENNINFPAGILQSPFYDPKRNDSLNYGGIGAVVGHELTHGFDDEGRQFDSEGNLHDWWTPEDAKEFEKRAQCFIQEYQSFHPLKDVPLNGKLTLGENTADNGGLRLAYMAMMASMGSRADKKLFFLGWGQIWCENTREEMARMLAQTNPHSPGEFRVNGVLSNMPEFREAYGCKIGQPMVRTPACRVW